jgi:plasmid maintenance system antidote protein VapI
MDTYMPDLTVGEFLKEEFMIPLGLRSLSLLNK